MMKRWICGQVCLGVGGVVTVTPIKKGGLENGKDRSVG